MISLFYSNEIVFRGHPDKVADQISDYLLDQYLKQDPFSRCAIEVVGGKGKIFVTGEVTSTANVNIDECVKYVLQDVGYSTEYEIINNLGRQSLDISQGVDAGGAGDQGMMFGYACRDTLNGIPLAMHILQTFSMYYDELRKSDYRFLPDGKAQITGCYDENGKLRYIKDFVVSYQNTEEDREYTDGVIINYLRDLCHQHYISVENFHINPTGKFLIGGFDGDAGLTGRKIVCDTYQGFAPVGGGAFSGKDPTKVDRSGAYKARNIALSHLYSNPELDWVQVQLSYAIGMDEPLAIYIKTDKDDDPNYHRISKIDMKRLYRQCTPDRMIQDLCLGQVPKRDKFVTFDPGEPVVFKCKHKNFSFYETAKFGHFGINMFPWESTI